MRVQVIIPTTAGPTQIRYIRQLGAVPLSQIVTEDDFMPIESMSERYHALLSSAGPLAPLLGGAPHRFELGVDHPPETGRSWELPVALAHWFLAQGHDLVCEDPDIVVWATGSVSARGDLAVDPEFVGVKLERSRTLLDRYSNAQRRVLILPHYVPDLTSPLAHSCDTVRVSNLVDAVEGIAKILKANSTALFEPRSSRPDVRRFMLPSIVLFAMPMALVASREVSVSAGSFPVTESVEAAALPNQPVHLPIQIIAHRAPAPHTCIDVIFSDVATEREEIDIRERRASIRINGNLCGLSITLKNGVSVTLPSPFLKQFITTLPSKNHNLESSMEEPIWLNRQGLLGFEETIFVEGTPETTAHVVVDIAAE